MQCSFVGVGLIAVVDLIRIREVAQMILVAEKYPEVAT
jgi:hypothetical protein